MIHKTGLINLSLFFCLLYSIIYTEKKRKYQNMVEPYIIHYPNKNRFVNPNNIKKIIINYLENTNRIEAISGLKIIQILDKKSIYIKKIMVYKNIMGQLRIHIIEKKPIARIIHFDKPDVYIDELGNTLPVSKQYTARVLLIHSKKKVLLQEYVHNKKYFIMLHYLVKFIAENAFWKKQIVQIDIEKQGKILMYTQISKQHIFLGKIEKIEEKFHKLKKCYTHILAKKGWNTYKIINLAYDKQIICQ